LGNLRRRQATVLDMHNLCQDRKDSTATLDEPEWSAGFPACGFERLSSRPMERRGGKPTAPAGWKACATSHADVQSAGCSPVSNARRCSNRVRVENPRYGSLEKLRYVAEASWG